MSVTVGEVDPLLPRKMNGDVKVWLFVNFFDVTGSHQTSAKPQRYELTP